MVSGENFYSRLREPTVPTAAPPFEGLTPEYLRAAVARTARLDSRTDTLPATEPARPSGITPLLEPLLADFVAGEPD